MAVNRTPNLGLHDWLGTEYVKREEIVENFRKIDNEFGVNGKIGILSTEIDSLSEEVNAARTEQIGSSRLKDNDIPASKLKISTDADKIKLVNLSDEVLQAMAGTTPVNATPGIKSVTNEKYADKSISVEKTDFVQKGKNIFNKDLIRNGIQLDKNTGAETTYQAATQSVTDFIPVDANTDYILSGTSHEVTICSYNINKVIINGSITNSKSFTTPSNAAYVKFSFTTADKDTIQLEKGTVATSYEPYKLDIPYLDNGIPKLKSDLQAMQTDIDDLKVSAQLKPNIVKVKKPVMKVVSSAVISEPQLASQITNRTTYNAVVSGSRNPLFRYVGDVGVAGTIYPDTLAVANKTKGGFSIEFMFFGTQLEIKEKGTGAKILVAADDELISDNPLTATPPDGSTYYRLITFTEQKMRKIRVFCPNNAKIFGFNVGGNETIFPVNENKIRAIFFGDSITEAGSSGFEPVYGYPAIVSQIFDWDGWNSGSGGTGFLNPGPAGRVKFRDRLDDDVVRYNPDVLIVCGGLNDERYPVVDVINEAQLFFNEVKTKLPNTEVIIISPFSPQGTPPQVRKDITAGLKNIAINLGYPYIDIVNGETYNKAGTQLVAGLGNIITGAGNAGNPQTTGNATVFISADGTHPTRAGHMYLGQRIAEEIARIYDIK